MAVILTDEELAERLQRAAEEARVEERQRLLRWLTSSPALEVAAQAAAEDALLAERARILARLRLMRWAWHLEPGVEPTREILEQLVDSVCERVLFETRRTVDRAIVPCEGSEDWARWTAAGWTPGDPAPASVVAAQLAEDAALVVAQAEADAGKVCIAGDLLRAPGALEAVFGAGSAPALRGVETPRAPAAELPPLDVGVALEWGQPVSVLGSYWRQLALSLAPRIREAVRAQHRRPYSASDEDIADRLIGAPVVLVGDEAVVPLPGGLSRLSVRVRLTPEELADVRGDCAGPTGTVTRVSDGDSEISISFDAVAAEVVPAPFGEGFWGPWYKSDEWGSHTLEGGVVYALHRPCGAVLIVPQPHDCAAFRRLTWRQPAPSLASIPVFPERTTAAVCCPGDERARRTLPTTAEGPE